MKSIFKGLHFLLGSLLFLFVLLIGTTPAFASSHAASDVHPVWIIPFITLLLSIAIIPLINKHFWEKYYPAIAIFLGLITIFYYLLIAKDTMRLLHTGHEYISFISLIGSLFVVTGGILIRVWKPGRPITNVILLAIGAVIANFIGTTGASALLIRPFIRINRGRLRPYHIVFFIFIVANCGGALTPIGDPPLFLGYIKGIPFFWLFEHVWYKWMFVVGLLLLIFYLFDIRNQKQASHDEPPPGHKRFEIEGAKNFFFLLVIILAVLFNKKMPIFVPELIQLSAAFFSYRFTSHKIHHDNDFTFHPIKEVALLFVGIFATMIPALQYLELHASEMGIQTPGMFYWMTGMLSSFLDNAPTYLTFLSAAFGLHGATIDSSYHMHWILGLYTGTIHPVQSLIPGDQVIPFVKETALPTLMVTNAMGETFPKETSYYFVVAISMAAVFFGAMTYIGNGPNFMVKSIADELGCDTPTFFGYMMKYSIPILLPVLFITWFLWYR
ncbi:MAG: sodium:proton antiporter [bacterium]|nr:sodium:proton antiporter [bacterium]